MLLAGAAHGAPLGDVNLDGVVGPPDVLLLQRHLEGEITLSTAQQIAADVAPLAGSPLGAGGPVLGPEDLLVLLRAARGEVALPAVAVPSLDPVAPVSTNGVRVTGGGVADGTPVHLFLDGTLATTAVAAGGGFEADLPLAADGGHELVAVAEVAGQHGGPSAVATFQSTDAGPTYGSGAGAPIPEIPAGETAVWFPRAGGEAYEIQGTLTVAPAASLTIHPGAVVELGPGAELVASGPDAELVIAGAPDPDRVQMVAEGGATTRGYWEGIRVEAGAQGIIDQALVAYAARGITVADPGSDAFVTQSEVFGNAYESEGGYGIRVHNGAWATLEGNLIYSGQWDALARECVPGSSGLHLGSGIEVIGADLATAVRDNDLVCLAVGVLARDVETQTPPDLRVEIADNRIEQNNDGIWLDRRGDPQIDGNQIIDNLRYGIYLFKSIWTGRYPLPVITRNQIHGNLVQNVYALQDGNFGVPGRTPIFAEDNYWGTTNSDAIAASIRDTHEVPDRNPWDDNNVNAPLIDWVPFRDAPDGALMLGTHLVGDIPTGPHAPQPDTTYKVFKSTRVAPGTSVVIPRGVTLIMYASLLVEGDLTVAGENGPAPAQGGVLFTSPLASPTPQEYWGGINAYDGFVSASSLIDINFATIEYVTRGLRAADDTVNVRDSVIRSVLNPAGPDTHTAGLWIERGTIGEIVRNDIEGNCADPRGVGIRAIYYTGSSLGGTRLVSDNRVACFNRGFGRWNNSQERMAKLDIRGNLIEGNRIGVYLSRTPFAFAGNTVTANSVRGIDIRTAPGVPMAGNEIFANGDGNGDGSPDNVRIYEFNDFPRTTLDLSGTYWGVFTPAEILETFDLDTSTLEVVDIDYSDFLLERLDTPGGPSSSGTLNHSFFLFGVDRADSNLNFNPVEGGTGIVSFQLYEQADVELLICAEVGDRCTTQSPVRTIFLDDVPANPAGPPHTIAWDGKDDAGNWVPESAYVFAVRATGTQIPGRAVVEDTPPDAIAQDPPAALCLTCSQNAATTLTPDLNAYENRFLTWEIELGDPNPGGWLQWIDLTILLPGPDLVIEPHEYLPRGTHQFTWDGRLPDGSFYEGPFTWRVHGGEHEGMRNWFIVEGTEIAVESPDPGLHVEVRSNPFLAYHSYEQVATIVYRVSRDADVRVTLLPPGIYDPLDAQAIELLPTTFQSANDAGGDPIDHAVEWHGYDPADPNDIRTAEEGIFTFAIEASDPASPSTKTIYRGALQLRR